MRSLLVVSRNSGFILIALVLHSFQAYSQVPHDIVCGVNCVYTLLKLYEVDVELKELTTEEYVTTDHGSTLADLDKAFDRYGVKSIPVNGLSVHDLASWKGPAILNTRKGWRSETFDHYVVAFDHRDSQVLIIDPPRKPEWVSATVLQAGWNGAALLVGADESDSAARQLLVASKTGKAVQFLVIGIAIACVGYVGQRRFVGKRRALPLSGRGVLATLGQGATCCAIALGVGFAYHGTSAQGFWKNEEVLANIERANFESFFRVVDRSRLVDLMQGDAPVLVDARRLLDYQSGHIRGAIHIEPNASIDECARALGDIDKDEAIVLYCQSASCPYAKTIALKLYELGYKSLSHYKVGWADWGSVQTSVE